MADSENDTESYRQEQGKSANAGEDTPAERMPLGSAIRGPIGREGAEAPLESDAEEDRRQASE